MTNHYFENELVKLHYYQFGKGGKAMLCFHGYGMHGKQFKVLEETLGDNYTFYGFDLFFHKETKLINKSVENLKKGITKKQLSELFLAFCDSKSIDKFSIIAYSMGSFYATALVEEIPERIEKFIAAAPSSLNPGKVVNFLSTNSVGNKLLERLALSDNGMLRLLSWLKKSRIIDEKAYEILHREIATPELRFSFYACTSYLRFLKLNPQRFIKQLNHHHIKSIFIFGKKDKSYPIKIGRTIIPQITNAKQLIIDENHDMINQNFAKQLLICLNDY